MALGNNSCPSRVPWAGNAGKDVAVASEKRLNRANDLSAEMKANQGTVYHTFAIFTHGQARPASTMYPSGMKYISKLLMSKIE